MKFKKGDKVRVYGHIVPEAGSRLSFYCTGNVARVTFVSGFGDELTVKMLKNGTASDGYESEVHAKQCRKNKKC